jgi:hypothetical protein
METNLTIYNSNIILASTSTTPNSAGKHIWNAILGCAIGVCQLLWYLLAKFGHHCLRYVVVRATVILVWVDDMETAPLYISVSL